MSLTKKKMSEILDQADLNEREKMLLVKIHECAAEKGYCNYTNTELGKMFGSVSITTISTRVNSLRKKGYIRSEMVRENVPKVERRLYPIEK